MTTVVDNVQLHRYEVVHDGALAGYAQYERGEGTITFTHTVIDDAFGGKGLASTLVKHVLNDARDAGIAVLPACPFVRGYIGKHPEYLGLVLEDRRAEFDL
ncbi:GNAT family N-acetyltransferase [Umezawaea sp. Da 62-37]|uniref:GNAT family N-acetyltransferase n=1 Tax=Umezawaea sp. Da 62-37 TaxID=3075927 RepID=UPI0028F7367B|nr:GNAT family N-acetyltransferase [Umezawaea sp. Da 62-37]WNV84379.1 GNAT family N-acetyltransferase [Umezawaea sp. Da 62-37]